MDPLLVKLWNLAGQPEPHNGIESVQGQKLGEIAMTLVPRDNFMRFLGTMQLLLFKIRPLFYTASYLKDIEIFKKRSVEKKPAYTLTDFSHQVFRLVGANITELTFEELLSDIRAVLQALYSTQMSSKRNQLASRHSFFPQPAATKVIRQ